MALLFLYHFSTVRSGDEGYLRPSEWFDGSGPFSIVAPAVAGNDWPVEIQAVAAFDSNSEMLCLLDATTSGTQVIVGGLFRSGTADLIIEFWSGGELGTKQCSLTWDYSAGGVWIVKNGAGSTQGTTTWATGVGDPFMLEFKVTFDTSSGSVAFYQDGLLQETISGIDTQDAGVTTCDTVEFRSADTFTGSHAAWLYIADTSGSGVTDVLGNPNVTILNPSSDGTYTDWTPLASTNESQIDEADPDDDTSYNYTATLNNKDTFNFDSIANSTVHAVGLQHISKTMAGIRKMKAFRKLSTTEVASSRESTLTLSYKAYVDWWETDPDGSGWTYTNVNSCEFGYQLSATS